MCPMSLNPASFVGRSKAEVFDRLASKLPLLTDYTYMGEGSIIRAIIESISAEIGNAYAVLNYSYGQQILSEATGLSLDALGALYNVTRRTISSVEIQRSFYFYLASSPSHQIGVPTTTASEEFTVPSGTLVSPGNNIVGNTYSFETLANVTFSVGESVKYVNIRPVNTALSWNIAPHVLRVHNYTGDSYEELYCTNPIELVSNTSRETDSDYRARIMEGIRSIASSNLASMKLAALSINHVRDARVFERPYGPATARVVFAVDYGYQGDELTNVTNAVEDVRPIGTYVEVLQAQNVNIDIVYSLMLEDESLRAVANRSVESAIKSYIGSLAIGQTLRRSQLIEKMFTAVPVALDANIASIKINGRNFIGDSYKIPDDSICTLISVASL